MTTPQTRSLLPDVRRAELLDALRRNGTMRVSELSDLLGVSPVTVRRDIGQLADEGVVRRLHGGAALRDAEPAGRGTRVPTEEEPDDVRALMPGPTLSGSIGMLVPSLDYYWPGVVRGAEQEARRHHLRVLLRGSSYESDDDGAQLDHLLAQPGIEGLILAPNLSAPGAQDLLDRLASGRVPTVLVEREATVPPHHQFMESVVSDHASGAGAAVRHLANLGHRRIGLVMSRDSPTGPHVRRGWREACQELGFDISATVEAPVGRRQSLDFDPEIEQVIDKCLSTGTTALLVHADSEAIALVQHCQQRGLAVPGHLSIVAYDDEVADIFSPPLTAVHPPRTSVGRAAVELLAARLADRGRPVHRVTIAPRLILRASTAPPRQA